jgi:peptidyl-prolyl cis-trans isomerase C
MSQEQLVEQLDALKQKAKDQAIGAKLLIMEAERLDLQVPVDEVQAKLDEMINNAGGYEAFQDLIARQNMTEESIRETVSRGRKVDMLVEKITEGISDPAEAEIKDHFEQHSKEYAKPERAQAQHILIKVESNKDDDKKIARSRMLQIRKEIEEGADFGEKASAYSDCPSGQKTGGSLGWFSRGMMVPEFDKIVFDMEIGELSDIVETQFGYHIIYKNGHEEGGEASFTDAKENVREFLRHVKRGEAITAYVDDLKSKVVIEEG